VMCWHQHDQNVQNQYQRDLDNKILLVKEIK